MRLATVFGLGVLGMILAAPAQALTISNTDDKPHTVTIKTAGDSAQLVVEPQKAVEAPCASGCTVELENGDQYGVPFLFFSDADLEVLRPGWERWLAAKGIH